MTYLQTVLELLLLFVDYAESKVDLIGLLKVWLHAHNLRESFFGMFQGSVTIIKDTNAIPQFGLLCNTLATALR